MKAVLFVGAGRHQRRAIEQARARLGLRVVAVDRNPQALGLLAADAAEAVDFTDLDAVTEAGRRHAVDGVLTVSADRAVPVVAAVAERLGLPGIGTETAHLMTHKIAMRRTLAEEGVPQPRFAGGPAPRRGPRRARDGRPARRAQARRLGRPARRFPPRDRRRPRRPPARGARGVARRGEAIVESFAEGTEMNGIVIARDGERPAGHALGPAAPARRRLRGRLDPRLSRRPSTATSSRWPSRSRCRRFTHSDCATGSRSRS